MSFINWGNEPPEQKEARRRYEEEQALFEQVVRFSRTIGSMAGAAGSSKLGNASTNQYVEDDYIDDYFI
jgi:hypothetical protein